MIAVAESGGVSIKPEQVFWSNACYNPKQINDDFFIDDEQAAKSEYIKYPATPQQILPEASREEPIPIEIDIEYTISAKPLIDNMKQR
jgi:hypothetical protein